jgi:Na+-transporting methylmalonyl-CoA/oxaloacetate decarboxylase beta subunit
MISGGHINPLIGAWYFRYPMAARVQTQGQRYDKQNFL